MSYFDISATGPALRERQTMGAVRLDAIGNQLLRPFKAIPIAHVPLPFIGSTPLSLIATVGAAGYFLFLRKGKKARR